MNSLSIRTKLVVLFSALVAVPLVAAIAWLGITAHRSVSNAGRALTWVADASLQQAASDVARLTADNADRSRKELVRIGRRSLKRFAGQEIGASRETVRRSTGHLNRTGSAVLQGATERIARASAGAVSDANTRLRGHQRQAVTEMSQALIGSSRRAFDRISQDLTAESEDMVIRLARDLTAERARRTAELVSIFLQRGIDAATQGARDPRMLASDPLLANRLRQLVDQNYLALLRAELLSATGERVAQWPPPLVPEEAGPLPPLAAKALASDQSELSPPEFGAPGSSPLMEIAVAVRGGTGRSLGPSPPARRVLIATLSLDALQYLLPRQSLGGGQPAPLFVMDADGRILAHSDPSNVGNSLSLPSPRGARQVEGNTVLFETPGGGQLRQLLARTEVPRTHWAVVAVQPLTHLLAQTAELRRAIRRTAETAANEMDREAAARAAQLEASAFSEQRRVADETADRIRRENQKVARAAVTDLVKQQAAIADGAVTRMERDATAASRSAGVAMDRTAAAIIHQSAERIRFGAARRARLNLASMHELASRTAAMAAGNIVIEASGVLVVALLAALLVALLTAQSAVRPITALAGGALSIARGDFSHRVRIRSEDELGQLAAAFNQMAASIEASRAELEASNITLAHEKRRIQAIVDNSPDGLLILSEDGSVGYANPSARALLPWREPARGNGAVPLEAVLSPELLHSLNECLAAIDSGDVSVCDVVLENPRRVLQVRSVVLDPASGRDGSHGAGRLIHLHDVTREREIDEMKSNFVMLVSHELRTPLTSILGFSSYMLMGKMGPLTEPQRGGLESIERQAQRLKAIASDFLDLSLIETGRLAIRRDPVDVERVARRVMEELTPQARERGLWLRLSPSSSGPAIAVGDEARIAQIFTNLVHNGVKFTEQGGVEIAIMPGRDEVRVEVRDTGPGVPEEMQARIFDRFFQVEGVVTRRAGGTGLGLSIVKELVQAHAGEVGVISRPAAVDSSRRSVGRAQEGGSGTTFFFTLPTARAASGRPAAEPESSSRIASSR